MVQGPIEQRRGPRSVREERRSARAGTKTKLRFTHLDKGQNEEVDESYESHSCCDSVGIWAKVDFGEGIRVGDGVGSLGEEKHRRRVSSLIGVTGKMEPEGRVGDDV